MITLTESEAESLRDLFRAQPVTGDQIARMTGLDVRQLLEAKIVRRLGRWLTVYYAGENFPNEPKL